MNISPNSRMKTGLIDWNTLAGISSPRSPMPMPTLSGSDRQSISKSGCRRAWRAQPIEVAPG